MKNLLFPIALAALSVVRLAAAEQPNIRTSLSFWWTTWG